MIKYNNSSINNWNFGDDNITKVYYNEAVVYQKIPHDYSKDYLTFVATESGTFKFSGNSINYSLDSGATWTELASDTSTPTVTAGNKVMWKASGLTPNSNIGIGTFSSTANFTAEGNIMSLYFGDNFSDQTSLSGKSYAYRTLFSGCTTLTSVENLCLLATTLAASCYRDMFWGCTELTKAPKELLATTLEAYCYCGMFNGCTSLTAAPELPATTLTASCYRDMFNGCTSLSVAPELPATNLSGGYYCYCGMFYGCTSLTESPILPATTLVSYCYYSMFRNCSNLSSVTCLATDISASNCTSSWLVYVASNGTFNKAASMSSWTSGGSGIPNGWTVQDVTPPTPTYQ